MPRTKDINWTSASRGEDSATAASDPLSIADGYCAKLENIEPSTGRMKPRDGSRKIAKFTNIWWMGEYQKSSGGYGLVVDTGSLYAVNPSGGVYLVKAGWLTDREDISTVRVGKYLILLADKDRSSLVVYERDGVLTTIPAYMRNEEQAIARVWTQVIEEDFSWTGQHYYVPETLPKTYGGYDASLPRNMTFTWVCIEGQDGKQFDLTTGMPGAQLESWERVATRTQAEYCRFLLDEVGIGGGMGSIHVDFAGATVPEGATHLRLYMTLPGTISRGDYTAAQQAADGLVYRWVADVPVGDLSAPFIVPGSDGALSASVNLCWSTGRDDLPPGGSIKFFDGRLWVFGGKSESNPGRAYFSSVIDGSTEQLSRLLSFRYDTDFKDTSTDESEPGVGMAMSHGLLILFNSRSVYSLRGTDYQPEPIDSTRGAVGGITEIGQRAFYLSQEGPAVVAGTTVDSVENFKSDMVQPGIPNFSIFFEPGAKVRGMWHRDSWMLTDGSKVACFKMKDNETGTWRLTPGEPMSFMHSCSPRKGDLWVGGDDKPIYSLMERGLVLDGNTPFLAKLATNATPVPGGSVSGEAYRIWTTTRWTDKSQLKIALVGDYGRVADLYQFEESLAPGMSDAHTAATRGTVMQVVRQGALSHWFQVELEKYIWAPDTLIGSVRLEVIARNWHPESISISDPGRAEPILDSGFITWDPETTEL